MAEVRQTDNGSRAIPAEEVRPWAPPGTAGGARVMPADDGMVDVSGLAAEDRRLVRRVVEFVRAVSSKQMPHARLEIVATDGICKVVHVNRTTTRDRF